jgi:predicted CoA-binding protein
MKKYIVITLLVLSTALVSAQKKKNKRFKTVTTELKETGFEVLEVEDNLEVYLEKDKTRNRD